MKIIQKSNIKGIYSGLSISNNNIVYYTTDFKLKFLNVDNLSLEKEFSFQRDFEYKVFDNLLYVTVDNELKIFDIEGVQLLGSCKADMQYIIPLSPKRFLASSYRRKDKVFDNIILDDKCKTLLEFNGDLSYRDIYTDEYVLLSDRKGDNIGLLDYQNCKILWGRQLNEAINGPSIRTDSFIIIPLSGSILSIDIKTGKTAWLLSDGLPFYNYDESTFKLFGMKGNMFEVIDVKSGIRVLQTELNAELHISSHLTSYSNGYLYFSGYQNNNVPVLGAVDVEKGKILFIQEVKISEEKSFRNGLDKPVIVGNRIYVKDSLKQLHVFERMNP